MTAGEPALHVVMLVPGSILNFLLFLIRRYTTLQRRLPAQFILFLFNLTV